MQVATARSPSPGEYARVHDVKEKDGVRNRTRMRATRRRHQPPIDVGHWKCKALLTSQPRQRARDAQRRSRQAKREELASLESRMEILSQSIDKLASIFTEYTDAIRSDQTARNDIEGLRMTREVLARFTDTIRGSLDPNAETEADNPTEIPPIKEPSPEASVSSWMSQIATNASSSTSSPKTPILSQNSQNIYLAPLAQPATEFLFTPFLDAGLLHWSMTSSVSEPTPEDVRLWYFATSGGLAPLLFWATIEHGVQLLQDLANGTSRPEMAIQCFSYSLRYMSVGHLVHRILRRLRRKPHFEDRIRLTAGSGIPSYYNSQHGQNEEEGLHAEHLKQLEQAAKNDLANNGTDISGLMDVWGVERRLALQWGLNVQRLHVLASPSMEMGTQSIAQPNEDFKDEGTFTQRQFQSGTNRTTLPVQTQYTKSGEFDLGALARIMQLLVMNAICLGTGPFFTKDVVDEIASIVLDKPRRSSMET